MEHPFQQTEVAEGVGRHLEAVEGLRSLVVVEAVKQVVGLVLGKSDVSQIWHHRSKAARSFFKVILQRGNTASGLSKHETALIGSSHIKAWKLGYF